MVCVNNLRQIGLAWRMAATSLNDKFPFQVLPPPSTFGFPGAYQWYQVISNELRTPKILVCPSDSLGSLVNDFAFLGRANVGYWIGFDVNFDVPRGLLGGDSNIQGTTNTSQYGYVDMPPQQAGLISWGLTVHALQGNILQADGAVHQYDNSGLQEAVRTSGGQSNRIMLPYR
jgi:hypothetical protein